MARKLGTNQIFGIALLVALILNFISVPFIDGRSIASIIVLVSAIYLIIIVK